MEDYLRQIVYESLEELTKIKGETKLLINRSDGKIYLSKKVSASAGKAVSQIMHTENAHLASVLWVHENPDEDCAEVVTEYVSGTSLSAVLKREKMLPEKRAKEIIRDVGDALLVLHNAGIVHRDVNPNNIIITKDGTAVLIDLGIARSFEELKSSDTVIMGTPGYAAPEQFGFTQSDAKTDIYALGVLYNVMLTGKMLNEERAQGKAGKIIDKCIKIDAVNRYNNLDALLRDMRVKSKKFYQKWWLWAIIVIIFSYIYDLATGQI